MARALHVNCPSPWVIATASHALPEDRDLPLQVTSDTAEFDELAGIATYQGDVRLARAAY